MDAGEILAPPSSSVFSPSRTIASPATLKVARVHVVEQISDIGSTSFPTKPTLNSRPGTICWIRTSAPLLQLLRHPLLEWRREVQTAPASMPREASSAAGLTMAGGGSPSGCGCWNAP